MKTNGSAVKPKQIILSTIPLPSIKLIRFSTTRMDCLWLCPELINQQAGVENGRYLYRNTLDDTDVTVDYGIENFTIEGTDEWNGRTFAYGGKHA